MSAIILILSAIAVACFSAIYVLNRLRKRRCRNINDIESVLPEATPDEPSQETANKIDDNAWSDVSQDVEMTTDRYNRQSRNVDIERWHTQDFVLGYKINRSRNCDCACEICCAGEGEYPLEFEWNGWHDGCLCYVTPILVDDATMASLQDIFLSGGDYKAELQKAVERMCVKDYPDNFKAWIWRHKDNLSDIINSKGLTDFISPNKEAVESILHGECPDMQRAKDAYQEMLHRDEINKFEFEYHQRERVFGDCNRIMQTTVNFDTFQRRAAEALDFIKWSFEQKAAGMPIKLNMSESEAADDFCRVFNKHCARIAREIAVAADSPRKAKNTLAKLEMIKSALKESEDKSEAESAINAAIFNLNIDTNGE